MLHSNLEPSMPILTRWERQALTQVAEDFHVYYYNEGIEEDNTVTDILEREPLTTDTDLPDYI